MKPFEIEIETSEIADLNARLAGTRWPEASIGPAWSRGVPLAYLKELVAYWRDGFDWFGQQECLNRHPQYLTTIDGVTWHIQHAVSKTPNAQALVLLHGWPGSFVEFQQIIGPLIDPEAFGLDASMAFDVVVPSMPGFGFSGPSIPAGLTSPGVAAGVCELMTRLGYEKFWVQGGDFGSFVGPDIGRLQPQRVLGVHVNAATVGFMPSGSVSEQELATFTPRELRTWNRIVRFRSDLSGYFEIQATRPQTLAYGLTDSPAGQLAWIVEKFKDWSDEGADLPQDAVDIDQLLTNVTVYWLTRTAASSANIYYEGARLRRRPEPSGVATGVAVFGEDLAIRRFAEPRHNIVHWSEFDRGGHFAAMESPQDLVADFHAFVRRVRTTPPH